MVKNMNWTESQKKAIEFPNTDVLVSAAAGSGKTATLTERVLRAVLDPDAPVDIRRMLIVTFTKKAAFELRVKIRKKLESYLESDPENAAVRRQLTLLPSADISTIHSFYIKLLRKNFAALGLPPKIGVSEESEFLQLKKTMMNDLIESYYNGEITGEYEIDDPETFFTSLSGEKTDENLCDVFSFLYSNASSYKEHLSYYKICAETAKKAESDYSNSPYYAYLRSYVIRKLEYFRDGFEKIYDDYGDDEQFQERYQQTIDVCYTHAKLALAAFEKFGYAEAREFAINLPFIPDFGRTSGSPGFAPVCKDLKGKYVKLVRERIPPLFSFTPAQTAEICKRTSDIYMNIYKFLSNFDDLFLERKLKYKKLEFNDLERYAYKLLCGENGEPTPEAAAVSESYDAIFIDEYQDVNSTQDAIFRAVSHNDRFMVGDIKQSIYGFRGSEPQLFSEYRKRAENKKPGEQVPDVLFLSDNFRCGKPVVDFTNMIFSKLFGADSAEIPYSEADGLVFAKKADVQEDVKVKVNVFAGPARDDDEKDHIVRQIKELLERGTKDSGERMSPADITVLCRKEDACKEIEKALKEKGVPVASASQKGFFDAPEIILTVSLLTAIDNPMRDIPLASVMRSPIFGFTADELALIRRNSPDTVFCEAVEAYAETENGKKCAEFLKRLAAFRKKSAKLPLEKFIRYIYGETAVMTLAFNKKDKGNKETRKSNLRKFYDLARKFDYGAYGGLSDFVAYCDSLVKNGKSVDVPAEKNEGSVTVQTIHKSKGLEYDAVFLYSANGDFTKTANKILNDRELGVAVSVMIGDSFVRGPVYDAITAKYLDNCVRDEMRLLYVAITRARKYLFITGKTGRGLPAKLTADGDVSLERVMGCKSYLDMVFLTVPEGETGCSVLAVEDKTVSAAAAKTEPAVGVTSYDAAFEQTVRDNIAFEYPYKTLSRLPNKVSVSKLYPAMLDSDETVCDIDPETAIPLIIPDGEQSEEEITAAARGTATHLFMQFCDFDSAENSVKEEAARLTGKGFLTSEKAEMLYEDEIKEFFSSGLYKRMSGARQSGRLFFREFRFNIGLDAAEFTNDPETKKELENETLLVQGVVDCFFEEEDGTVTVCDYKTDRIGKSREAVAAFADRHRLQLTYYKKALERITKKKVGRLVLYSFCIGREVDV